MTSLLGRLVRLFSDSVPLEDLFTEAVARLFERRPDLCVAWLKDAKLLPLSRAAREGGVRVNVSSQKWVGALDHQDAASRIDLVIEVLWSPEATAAEGRVVADMVMVESKIGGREGINFQLRRYAEHLHGMADYEGKALLYITRGYDPKDPREILPDASDVRFEQLRWRDFYRFLQRAFGGRLYKHREFPDS